jgi:hypothetical protein
MSTYGKRGATSPRENMAKRPTSSQSPHETDLDTLVKVEFISLNDKPFLGQVTDDELLYVWVKVFNRKLEDLFGVTSTKTLTRNARATYKLKHPIKLAEIYPSERFSYEKFSDDDGSSEVIVGKILGYGAERPVELGELVKVKVCTNFGVEASGVLNWLKHFGTVTSSHEFILNKSTGLRSDVFQAEVFLARHIPEYLPMYGQKVQIYYPGIPRMCNRCYGGGHMRKECNNRKKDWIEYIFTLVQNGVDVELIGTWTKALERWKNANADKQ